MSQRVAIVTDSTADIPPALAVAEGVAVVPLTVTIDGESFPDGSISQAEFFERMNRSSTLPTTSQPSVGAFTSAYESALETSESVLSIHLSEKLSGTIASARQAAEAFRGRVRVFDSKTLSWGLGFQVLAAARGAASAIDLAGVTKIAEAARDRVDMLVGLDGLKNLAAGGRIGKVAAFLGGILGVRVTLAVRDGEFVPVRRIRGATAALQHTLDWVAEQLGDARTAAFCVMHAMSPDRAESLADAIRERFDVSELHIVETGAVIAAHTGTGWAVAFLPER